MLIAAFSSMSTCRVGSPEVGWSAAASFSSGPEPAAVAQGREAFTFLVFNDVGQENAGACCVDALCLF
jgi:hypothetical protein